MNIQLLEYMYQNTKDTTQAKPCILNDNKRRADCHLWLDKGLDKSIKRTGTRE